MPRKALIIDPETMTKLGEMGCTIDEVAAWFDTSVTTVNNRLKRDPLKSAWTKGKARGRISLRRAMFQAATNGNVVAQIFLAKNLLGMADKVETKSEERTSFVVELPPPMAAADWAKAFSPPGTTIEHEPVPTLSAPGKK